MALLGAGHTHFEGQFRTNVQRGLEYLLRSQAADGNFQPLAAQFLMISSSLSESLSIGMHNAVMCTEDAPYFDGEAVTDEQLILGPSGFLWVIVTRRVSFEVAHFSTAKRWQQVAPCVSMGKRVQIHS